MNTFRMSDFQQTVLEYLLTIPKGKVVTYGQLAAAIGRPGAARAVGNALHTNPAPGIFPCFRVVDSIGRPAKNFGDGGAQQQIRRLEEDGIQVENGRVDLSVYCWRGDDLPFCNAAREKIAEIENCSVRTLKNA